MSRPESLWDQFPGYSIEVAPRRGRARAVLGDVVVAESDACLLLRESDHPDQLYFPVDAVDWELFTKTEHHTVCPFKGEADYWTLTVGAVTEENVVWTYRDPFEEVAGIRGYVAFYTDRVCVELIERWSDSVDDVVTYRFPTWGDAADLGRLIDVTPDDSGSFSSPPYPDPPLGTFIEIPEERRPRRVVEAGHLLGQAIVAASKTVPDQRVVTASMIFSRAAMFDATIDIEVDVLRRGRKFSTVETRTSQSGRLCSAGLLLLDAGAGDTIRSAAEMPDVPGPPECPPLDMGVSGREIRVVDGAYDRDPGGSGPPEIFTWVRFRDVPDRPALHAALLAQSTPHWTIAAAMRPHEGISEAMAHVTLSTGIMAVDVAFHDAVDVNRWLLYANPAIYAGRGQAQGQGRVFSIDGRLLASYSVHAMIREFTAASASLGGRSAAL